METPDATSAPLLSVVIPTCHRNDLLAQCLDRLAPGAQTLPPDRYEVIVTDDGSRTTAERLVREDYPWATWVAGPRKGPAANRNNGTKFAKGEYIAFTDDDCLPDPGWLLAYAEALVSGDAVYEGRTTCRAGIRSPLDEAPINLDGGKLWSCNMLVQASAYQRLGGFDESYPYPALEDVDFRERVRQAGHAAVFVPEASVDHPPRKRALGRRAATIWEAHIHHWSKGQLPHPRRHRLLLHIAKMRLRLILSYPFGRASVVAFGSMLAEIYYVGRYESRWEDKYRHRPQPGPAQEAVGA